MQTDVWAALQQRVCAWLPQRSALESPGNVLICGRGAGGWLVGWRFWKWLPWLRTLPRVVSLSAFPQQYTQGSWKRRQEKKKVRIDSHNNAQCSERTSKQPTSRYSSALKTAIKWLCAQQTPCVHRFWARPANVAAFTTVRLAVKCWDREDGFHCGSHCTKNCEVSSVWLSLAQILLSKHLH